jgi:hypothetical protein
MFNRRSWVTAFFFSTARRLAVSRGKPCWMLPLTSSDAPYPRGALICAQRVMIEGRLSRPFLESGFYGHAKAVLDRRKDSSQVRCPLEVLLDNFVGVTATVADRA